MRQGFGLARHVRALALLLAGLGNACSDEDPEKPSKAFWPLDFETTFVEVRDCRLSPAEHDGYYIRVFANPEAEAAYLEGRALLASGTQLVKGEYDDEDCSVLRRASGMLKQKPDTNHELRDWIWQRADVDGELDTSTPARSCVGCHAACENRDYACTDP